MLLQQLNYEEYVPFLNGYNLVWNSLHFAIYAA
jgi:hypothetical protein